MLYSDLLKLAEAAPVYVPDDPPPVKAAVELSPPADNNGDPLAIDRFNCEQLGLIVLGESPDQRIHIFSEHHGKNAVIRNIARFTYDELLQTCGAVVRRKVQQAADNNVPGTLSFSQVRSSIALLAGERRMNDDTICGCGCWPGENGEVVLVGAGEAAVWDGKQLHRVTRPYAAGLVLDISSSAHWYQFDRLQSYLEKSADPKWSEAAVNQAIELFEAWYWRQSGNVVPYVVAGLVMATWVETYWVWRPLVAITGESTSGKSSLFEAIASLFGPMSLLVSKCSEAGLRQGIKNQAVAVLVDEFETDQHRQRILEMLRNAGRGGRILRGTANQDGQQYTLRHLCWVAAVGVQLGRQADRNRFLEFDLEMPPKDRHGLLQIPSRKDLGDLGQRLLATAIRHVAAAQSLADRLKQHAYPGISTRIVESLAVPISLLALCAGIDDEEAATALQAELLDKLGIDPGQGQTDQHELLGALLESTVRVEKGESATVSQILQHTSTYPDGQSRLEGVGIAMVANRRGPRSSEAARGGPERHPWGDAMFVVHQAVKRYLLRGTQWEGESVDQILLRLPGAERKRCSVGGKRAWGVLLPWPMLREEFLTEDGEDGPGEF